MCIYKRLFLSVQVRFLTEKITLQAGIEPTAWWLTATRSTAELLKIIKINGNSVINNRHLEKMETVLLDYSYQFFH